MSNRYITHNGRKYLIRGPYTATELRELYKSVIKKYPMTFMDFLNRGKVHFEVKNK